MKVRTLRTGIAECLAEMMSLSFAVTGEPDLTFDVVWAPLEDESMASRANTAGILRVFCRCASSGPWCCR